MAAATVVVEWGGCAYEGFWWAQHGAVHVVSDLGAKSAELTGMRPTPAEVARGLLIALAAETRARDSRPLP